VIRNFFVSKIIWFIKSNLSRDNCKICHLIRYNWERVIVDELITWNRDCELLCEIVCSIFEVGVKRVVFDAIEHVHIVM